MKATTSIKLKAAFLLVVFALNTVVGFACALGVDMNFNSKHHGEEATEVVDHIHKDGKKHIHYEKKESHSHDKSHKHDEANKSEKPKSSEGNCCTDTVKQFHELDKSVPPGVSIIHPVFFTAFLSSFYKITLLQPQDVVIDIKQFVRSYHPPIPDIRIAIQSFQI